MGKREPTRRIISSGFIRPVDFPINLLTHFRQAGF